MVKRKLSEKKICVVKQTCPITRINGELVRNVICVELLLVSLNVLSIAKSLQL